MYKINLRLIYLFTVILVFSTFNNAFAQSSLEDISKSAQDPLANISAINLDNTLNFSTGEDDDTAYGLQIQGIYSFSTEKINFVPRVIVPVMAVPKGSDLPILEPGGGGEDTTWGIGDSMFQLFVSPVSDGNWKWGIGPQFSFPTHTNSDLRGPDWGAGVSGVLIGSVGNWSLGAVAGNLWSFDGNFSQLNIQPLVYYNIESLPGVSLSYNTSIIADWKIDSSDRWTVPVGAGIGKTFLLGSNGYAVDVSVGAYGVPIRPEGAPKAQLKLAMFFIFPR